MGRKFKIRIPNPDFHSLLTLENFTGEDNDYADIEQEEISWGEEESSEGYLFED